MILLGKMMSSWLFSCLHWYRCAHQTLRDLETSCCDQWQKDRVIMAQNVLVVSLRLNYTLILGYPVAYSERDPRSHVMVPWFGELQASLGCPTHSCCPETAAGHSQARERCRRTCLPLTPSSPEQEPLWVGLWTGTGRGAVGWSLCTHCLSSCSPSPLGGRGSGPGRSIPLQPGSGLQTPAGLCQVDPSVL